MKYEIYEKEGLKFIEVTNDSLLKVTLCDLGAAVYSIYFDNEVMTLTPKNISDFALDEMYYGKNIGPVACRIKDAKATINGKDYFLESNTSKGMALHGGKKGYSKRRFAFDVREFKGLGIEVAFKLFVKDMEIGWPGDTSLSFTYLISEKEDKVMLTTDAISTKDTLLALTNHMYFCMGEKSIKDLSLQISAHKQSVLDYETSLPVAVGPLFDVVDFNKKKNLFEQYFAPELQNCVAKGYDHNYILDNPTLDNISSTLFGKKYLMNIYTTFDGLQIYTCNYSDEIDYLSAEKGPRKGIALEPGNPLAMRRINPKNTKYYYQNVYEFKKI